MLMEELLTDDEYCAAGQGQALHIQVPRVEHAVLDGDLACRVSDDRELDRDLQAQRYIALEPYA